MNDRDRLVDALRRAAQAMPLADQRRFAAFLRGRGRHLPGRDAIPPITVDRPTRRRRAKPGQVRPLPHLQGRLL